MPSAIRPLHPQVPDRIRALDVGAGIGRVTADVLLHLCSDVVLVEPVDSFVQEVLERARNSANLGVHTCRPKNAWKGIADHTKSVSVFQGTLQDFNPMRPHSTRFVDHFGYQPARPADDVDLTFDVIWCQWCLGHLSDPELVAFLKRCHVALRDKQSGRSLIVIKENICQDSVDGLPCSVFDNQDSSVTRSDQAWKCIFKQSSLRLVKEKVQEGLPEELYVVKMYGLR